MLKVHYKLHERTIELALFDTLGMDINTQKAVYTLWKALPKCSMDKNNTPHTLSLSPSREREGVHTSTSELHVHVHVQQNHYKGPDYPTSMHKG